MSEGSTEERLRTRQRRTYWFVGAITLVQVLRLLGGTASAGVKVLQIVGMVAAGVVLVPIILWLARRKGRRIATEHPGTDFAGVATIYAEQLDAVPGLQPAVAARRRKLTPFLTAGQSAVNGLLVVDADRLRWTPLRIARFLRFGPWTLPRADVEHVEVNEPATPIKGRAGVATIHLRGGEVLDLTVYDRAVIARAFGVQLPEG